MQPVEVEKLAANEDSMWWFRGLHGMALEQVRRMALPGGSKLLDGGCGTGGTLQRIAAENAGLALFGLEIDQAGARLARDRAGAAITVASINELPFADASLDAILSLDVLCHAGVSVESSFNEFARCLRPGGYLFLSLPAYQWMYSGHDRAVSTARRFSRGGLRRALAGGKLEIEADGYWNSVLFPLMVVHRMLTREATKSDVRPFPAWQERLFDAALRLEAKLRRNGLALPFGGSVWVRCRRRP